MRQIVCDRCGKNITEYEAIPRLVFQRVYLDNGKRVIKMFDLCKECAIVALDLLKTLGVKDVHQ